MMDQTAPDMSMRSSERAARFGGEHVRTSSLSRSPYHLGAEIAFLIGTLSDRIFARSGCRTSSFCALLVTPPRQWWISSPRPPAHTIAELGVGMPIRN
jgi:hypothetical protein